MVTLSPNLAESQVIIPNPEEIKKKLDDDGMMFNLYTSIAHQLVPSAMEEWMDDISQEKQSRWNWVWVIPVNCIVNAFSFAITAIVALVQLTAAAFFATVGCVNGCETEAPKVLCRGALNSMTSGVGNLSKTFYPPLKIESFVLLP